MPAILPSNATVNITDTYTYMQWVQEATGNIFMPAVMFAIFIIVFVTLKGLYSNSKAFLGSSFLTMILAIISATLGFIENTYMYLTIVMTAIGAVFVYIEGTE